MLLSKTTELILTKFDWKYREWGFKFVQFKGMVTFGGHKEATIEEILGILGQRDSNLCK